MKLPSRQATLVGAAAVAGLTLLGGGAAIALVGPQNAVAALRAELDLDEIAPRTGGSVAAPRQALDDDAREAAALRSAATLSPQDAVQAATGHVPGSIALTNSLDEEDGAVVYEVQVRGADGTLTEVTVDAGDGRVLATEIDHDDLSVPGAPQPTQPAGNQPAPDPSAQNQPPQAPQEQSTP